MCADDVGKKGYEKVKGIISICGGKCSTLKQETSQKTDGKGGLFDTMNATIDFG